MNIHITGLFLGEWGEVWVVTVANLSSTFLLLHKISILAHEFMAESAVPNRGFHLIDEAVFVHLTKFALDVPHWSVRNFAVSHLPIGELLLLLFADLAKLQTILINLLLVFLLGPRFVTLNHGNILDYNPLFGIDGFQNGVIKQNHRRLFLVQIQLAQSARALKQFFLFHKILTLAAPGSLAKLAPVGVFRAVIQFHRFLVASIFKYHRRWIHIATSKNLFFPRIFWTFETIL